MEEHPKYLQIKNIHNIIGKKVFLDRIMGELELEMWKEDIAKGEESSDLIKKFVEEGKERKEGIFRRTIFLGKLNFIEPIYNVTEEIYSLSPKLMDRVDLTKPILNCYFEVDSSDIKIKKIEGIPLFEIATLERVPAEFISDADSRFKEYAEELKLAGFKIE